jgi:hypothetical protein
MRWDGREDGTMSTLQKLWCATREDLIEFGHASRPLKPGGVQVPSAEEIQRLQRKRLEKNGPKEMSAEGFSDVLSGSSKSDLVNFVCSRRP